MIALEKPSYFIPQCKVLTRFHDADQMIGPSSSHAEEELHLFFNGLPFGRNFHGPSSCYCFSLEMVANHDSVIRDNLSISPTQQSVRGTRFGPNRPAADMEGNGWII